MGDLNSLLLPDVNECIRARKNASHANGANFWRSIHWTGFKPPQPIKNSQPLWFGQIWGERSDGKYFAAAVKMPLLNEGGEEALTLARGALVKALAVFDSFLTSSDAETAEVAS